jgi:hypothetical protein
MSGFRDRPSIAIPGTRYLNTPRFFASSTISILIIWMTPSIRVQPTDRGMAGVVDASHVHGRLASITPCEDFLTLVMGQFRLAPNNAPSFGAFPAFTGGCGSIPAQTQQARPAPLTSADVPQ